MSALQLAYSNGEYLTQLLELNSKSISENNYSVLSDLFNDGLVENHSLTEDLIEVLKNLSKSSEDSFYIVEDGTYQGVDFENSYGLESKIYKFEKGKYLKGDILIQMPDFVE